MARAVSSRMAWWPAAMAAGRWRLLLSWLLLLLLPTLVVALPLWQALSGLLDHSVHAAAWARQFDVAVAGDALEALSRDQNWLGGAALAGGLLTLLLGCFLNGMAVGSGRAGRALDFGQLFQAGIVEYGRMFRLLLWALLPYALAAGIAAKSLHWAQQHAAMATLEAQADSGTHLAWAITGVAVLLAHAWVESARAAFIADPTLRSATRALRRGFGQLLRRPLSSLGCYVLVSALGYALAALFGFARLHVPAVGAFGFPLGVLLGQLIVVALGWMQVARLFGLAAVARSLRAAH